MVPTRDLFYKFHKLGGFAVVLAQQFPKTFTDLGHYVSFKGRLKTVDLNHPNAQVLGVQHVGNEFGLA